MAIPSPFLPPATIGVLGGGQLGRMLALEARRSGYRVVIFTNEAPGCPQARWQTWKSMPITPIRRRYRRSSTKWTW